MIRRTRVEIDLQAIVGNAEAVGLLMESRYGWAAALIVSHLAGSILMTILGIVSVRAVTG